MTERHK